MGGVTSVVTDTARSAQGVFSFRRGSKKLIKAARCGSAEDVRCAVLARPYTLHEPLAFAEGNNVWHLLVQRDMLPAIQQLLVCVESMACDATGLVMLVDLGIGVTCDMSPMQVCRTFLNLANNAGETPLHNACLLGRHAIAELLVKHGADPWTCDLGGGRSPLHHAAMRNHPQCIHSVLAATPPSLRVSSQGVRLVDVVSEGGFSSLHYAVAFNTPKAARALLTHQADIHISNTTVGWYLPGQSPQQSTALHIAAWKGYPEMCKMILLHQVEHPSWGEDGVLRDARTAHDAHGRTPQQLALVKGHLALAPLLDPGFDLRALAPRLDSLPLDLRSLTAIAATALRSKLAASVKRCVAQAEAQAQARLQASQAQAARGLPAAGVPPPASSTSPSLPGQSPLPQQQATGTPGAAPGAGAISVPADAAALQAAQPRTLQHSVTVPIPTAAAAARARDRPTADMKARSAHGLEAPLLHSLELAGTPAASHHGAAAGATTTGRTRSHDRHPGTPVSAAAAAASHVMPWGGPAPGAPGQSTAMSVSSSRESSVKSGSLYQTLVVGSASSTVFKAPPEAAMLQELGAGPAPAPLGAPGLPHRLSRQGGAGDAPTRGQSGPSGLLGMDEGEGGSRRPRPDPPCTPSVRSTLAKPMPGSPHARDMSTHESVASSGTAAFDPTQNDAACGVCWDARALVAAVPCGHGTCAACAFMLVDGLRKRPLSCPFCRGNVADFAPMPLVRKPGV